VSGALDQVDHLRIETTHEDLATRVGEPIGVVGEHAEEGGTEARAAAQAEHDDGTDSAGRVGQANLQRPRTSVEEAPVDDELGDGVAGETLIDRKLLDATVWSVHPLHDGEVERLTIELEQQRERHSHRHRCRHRQEQRRHKGRDHRRPRDHVGPQHRAHPAEAQ
jgi:hypothetical protein